MSSLEYSGDNPQAYNPWGDIAPPLTINMSDIPIDATHIQEPYALSDAISDDNMQRGAYGTDTPAPAEATPTTESEESTPQQGDDSSRPPTDTLPTLEGGDEEGAFLAFRQRFDGAQPEISSADKAQVAEEFSEYVKTVVNNSSDSTSMHFGSKSGKDGRRLEFRTQIDNRDATVALTHIEGEGARTEVYICELQERSYPGGEKGLTTAGDCTSYELRADNIVRRADGTLRSAATQQAEEIDPNAPLTNAEAAKILQDDFRAYARMEANELRNTILGLNHQPIGKQELADLKRVIDQAHANRVTTIDSRALSIRSDI
ncbi:MAG TPA: hypothetical protein VHT70_05070 [Candidatus Saccharimonadales bacterium]|nr:hypothetical protein [Candidatus Saccharimonadales bacterium]